MDSKQLISLEKVLEIEGLVMLINDRREKTPCQIYDLISSKLESLLTEIDTLRDQNEIIEDESEDIIICQNIKLMNNDASVILPDHNEELTETDISYENASSIGQANSENKDDEMNQIAESASFEESEDATDGDDNTLADTVSSDTSHDGIPAIPPIPNTNFKASPITEIMAQKPLQSEYPRLSLNDKYVFRRELFNFSDEDMAEALKIASEMTSAEEVEDYFYNDLCWDPENETVRHFIAIMTSRFK